MKLLLFKTARVALLAASVCSVSASVSAQYITFVAGPGKPYSETINVASNELATVVHLSNTGNSYLEVVCGGVTNKAYGVGSIIGGISGTFSTTYRHANMPIIAGPATLRLGTTEVQSGTIFCTVQITKPSSTFTPVNTVVIPNDSNGPVTIVLESSADMVSWVDALPGTYGTTSTNRFFRVRAER